MTRIEARNHSNSWITPDHAKVVKIVLGAGLLVGGGAGIALGTQFIVTAYTAATVGTLILLHTACQDRYAQGSDPKAAAQQQQKQLSEKQLFLKKSAKPLSPIPEEDDEEYSTDSALPPTKDGGKTTRGFAISSSSCEPSLSLTRTTKKELGLMQQLHLRLFWERQSCIQSFLIPQLSNRSAMGRIYVSYEAEPLNLFLVACARVKESSSRRLRDVVACRRNNTSVHQAVLNPTEYLAEVEVLSRQENTRREMGTGDSQRQPDTFGWQSETYTDQASFELLPERENDDDESDSDKQGQPAASGGPSIASILNELAQCDRIVDSVMEAEEEANALSTATMQTLLNIIKEKRKMAEKSPSTSNDIAENQ